MPPHQVAVLALNGVLEFELGMPVTILRSLDDLYAVSVVTPTTDGVRTGSGLHLAGGGTLDDLDAADTVIVPGYDFEAGTPNDVVDVLQRSHARGARVASLCVGAFALAEAGLLTDRRATTHWLQTDRLSREYPSVDVDPDALFVDEESILTSAGTSAGIDLCLHLVRTDYGTAVANRAARNAVAAPHREGGQTQFIDRHLPVVTAPSLAATREWALGRLDASLHIPELASRAHLSPRTFIRRFIAETGMPPMRWLRLARIDLAKQLLEQTAMSVDDVARSCGLGTAANFRTHFGRSSGLTPSAYRAKFSARR